MSEISLEVNKLRIGYFLKDKKLIAVNDVSFNVYKGELLGLVGESGCGKTTTAMGILKLIQNPGRIIGGEVFLRGNPKNILELDEKTFRRLRWAELSLIPQGAMNSLNPVKKIKDQIIEAIEVHEGRRSKAELKARIIKLFSRVGLPSRIYNMYPDELSGGMKQRVCIAMAVVLEPKLIVADEPTSALDVIVQRTIAQTLLDIKKRLDVSMIMIGHDMGLMAQMADRIAVMYAGVIVEIAAARKVLKNPQHPYTKMLIEAVPSIKDKDINVEKMKPRVVKYPDYNEPGCIYRNSCPYPEDICLSEKPLLRNVSEDQQIACHFSNGELYK